MSTVNGSVRLNTHTHQALENIKRQAPKKLEDQQAKEFRKAVLADGVIDTKEQVVINHMLKGDKDSQAKVQELLGNQFSPDDFKMGLSQGAQKTLQSVAPLPETTNAQEAIKAMQDKGFVQLDGKNVHFDFTTLENYSSEDIQKLMGSIEKNPADAKKYKMLSFMLQSVGSTLKNPQEKANFIQEKVHGQDHTMSGMAHFLRAQPMDVVSQALRESLKHSNEAQTLDFLKESGFIIVNQDVDGHWDIRPRALEHLPADVLEAANQNIQDSFWGEKKYVKSALQRMISH